MSALEREFGDWRIACLPQDGARISLLQYKGFDLLTPAPETFRAPQHDYGAYEERPVYGYDDCFPSVAACRFPGLDWEVPDHGEVCWLPWQVSEQPDGLLCQVESKRLPLTLSRRLTFQENQLEWHFKLENHGGSPVTVQHVMHPLMPIRAFTALRLPEFECAWDDIGAQSLPWITPAEAEAQLLATPEGTTRMWFLQNIKEGRVTANLVNGMHWIQEWPAALFPSLALWWNYGAYPDEDGLRRYECALEPVPGKVSHLEAAGGLTLPANQSMDWRIKWILR